MKACALGAFIESSNTSTRGASSPISSMRLGYRSSKTRSRSACAVSVSCQVNRGSVIFASSAAMPASQADWLTINDRSHR